MKIQNLFRICSLIVLFLAFTMSVSYADSCPYCGMPYGEPWPGDEERVYALRADHEANCPSRPGVSEEVSDDDGSDSGIAPDYVTREDAWAVHKQKLEHREKIRWAQEQKRIQNIDKEARRRAEAEKRRIEWEQKKNQMMGMLKGASDTSTLKADEGEEVILKPKGTNFFRLPRHDEDMLIVTKTVGGKKQSASPDEIENLRRSLWLYQKAAQARSAEEAHFLTAQGDEAAQGHDLRVEVPPAGQTSEISQKRLQEFVDVKAQVEVEKIKLEEIWKKKRFEEDKQTLTKNELAGLENQLKKSKQEPPAPTRVKELPQDQEKKKREQDDLLARIRKVKEDLKNIDHELKDVAKEEGIVQAELGKTEARLKSVTSGGKR